MGVSVHEPRQSNITYVHTFIWSIYDTRRPEQPHLPILQCKRGPHLPASSATLQTCICHMDGPTEGM